MNRGFCLMLLVTAVGYVGGCQTTENPTGRPVTEAWESPRDTEPAVMETAADSSPMSATGPAAARPAFDPIAIVNGSPLNREAFVRLMTNSYGLSVLEQLVMLQVARQKTSAAKLRVTQEDIRAEYERTLARMSLPPAGEDHKPLDAAAGEALLREFLSSKNISREQYMLSIERNANLRKLIEKDLVIKDDDLRPAFDRIYGERVQVRHIQVGSLEEAAAVRGLLDKGRDFAEIAKERSRNTVTGADGGLLRPFTSQDKEFPPLFIDVAFALQEGQTSRAVRVGDAFHLIKLVKRYPTTKVAFEDVKAQLTQRVKEELIVERMQRVGEGLLREATIRILDADLEKQFRDKYGK